MVDLKEKTLAAPLIKISSVVPSTESLASCDNHMFQGKESFLTSQINLFIKETGPKIPDGGWGWLVVLGAFFINLVSDGVSFTFGLLYIEFLNEFGASKSATSWIGSLFMAVPLLAGPIGSALVDKYGCKSMTVVGGLICTTGFVLSSYAKSIAVMYVTFGVIGGIGLGLCYVTAVVSIAFWFEKKRTIALGLAASGTGFGTVIYSPLTTFLLGEYGWRGTVLVLGGFFANMCVSGFLMRDPDWILEEENGIKKNNNKTSSKHSSKRNSICQTKSTKQRKIRNSQYVLENLDTYVDLSERGRFRSMINLPTYLKQNEQVPLEVLKNLSNNKQLYSIILENYPNLLSCKSTSDIYLKKFAEDASLVTTRVPVRFSMKLKKSKENRNIKSQGNGIMKLKKSKDDKVSDNRTSQENGNSLMPFMRQDSVTKTKTPPHSYLKNVRFRRNSIGYRGAMLNIHRYKLTASSCPNIFKNSMTTLAEDTEEKWYDQYVDVLKDLTHFSLFLELHFLLMCLSTIILFIWFIVPYFYLADHMKKCGYTETQSSFVISVIGITNTIGMVVLGWLGDKINVTKVYAVCLILCGVTCAAMLVFTNIYILLVICGGLFGLFFASCFSLTPSILAQLVPLDSFTMAYGLFLLCQGIGNLTGPPLAGLLFDLTNSWDQSFYQAGFWIIISGILIGIIPYTENRRLLGSGPLRMDQQNIRSQNGKQEYFA